jgi:HK97 gp10 family phage protein
LTRIDGLSDLITSLNQLTDKVKNNIVRSGVRSGATVIRDAIKAKAPVLTGKTKKSIKVKAIGGKKSNKDLVTFKVRTGVITEFNQNGDASQPRHVNYAKQLEFGNSKMAAQPFVRPAFEEVEQQVLGATVEKIQLRVDSVNNSKGGKGGWE